MTCPHHALQSCEIIIRLIVDMATMGCICTPAEHAARLLLANTKLLLYQLWSKHSWLGQSQKTIFWSQGSQVNGSVGCRTYWSHYPMTQPHQHSGTTFHRKSTLSISSKQFTKAINFTWLHHSKSDSQSPLEVLKMCFNTGNYAQINIQSLSNLWTQTVS